MNFKNANGEVQGKGHFANDDYSEIIYKVQKLCDEVKFYLLTGCRTTSHLMMQLIGKDRV